MNANTPVQFKQGLVESLPSTKEAGTFYVTTNEKGLYLDISSSERIRVDSTLVATDDGEGNVTLVLV